MMAMPAHILIGLWNQKRKVLEERIEEERKQQEKQKSESGISSMPNPSSMMSQAQGMMGSMTGRMNMPNLPSGIR